MKFTKLLTAGMFAVVMGAMSAPAFAAEDAPKPPEQRWSFSGPFGKYDPQQLQRGFKVFREVCAACHSLKYVAFRNLADPSGPMFTEGQVKALAAEYKIQDGPNDAGEMFERPGRPADYWPSPFPNDNAAAAANGGKAPPDLSLMAKARTYERGFPQFIIDIFTQYAEQGPDYIYALLTGYEDAPKGFQVPEGGHYNKYFPGHVIAMPKPMSDGQVDYKGPDGKPQAPETVEQYARDVTAFLMWTAEPKMEARKALGFKSVIFLIVLAALTWFTKKRIWKKLPDPA
ncbi:cytochrome c1 [Camelimonas abortus]|uniref:Cytochrome c1 n=1 Tax=Camelimonas abortus TaxID=1017184 RepID=A0ABV7LEW5_9HYPH